MTNQRQAHQAAQDYFAHIGRDDEAFLALFADDVRFEDPVGTPAQEGPDGVRRFLKGLHQAWSWLEMEISAIYVRERRAAVQWSATGESASGKTIAFDGINVIAVDEDGLIRRLEGYWDLEGVLAQM